MLSRRLHHSHLRLSNTITLYFSPAVLVYENSGQRLWRWRGASLVTESGRNHSEKIARLTLLPFEACC